MKHYIFLHNMVMMAIASVTNSVEGYDCYERRFVIEEVSILIERYLDFDKITKFQADKLSGLLNAISTEI